MVWLRQVASRLGGKTRLPGEMAADDTQVRMNDMRSGLSCSGSAASYISVRIA